MQLQMPSESNQEPAEAAEQAGGTLRCHIINQMTLYLG